MSKDNIQTIDTFMLNQEGFAASYLLGHRDEFAIIETGVHSTAGKTFESFYSNPHFEPEKVKYILTTHIHLDHSGGASFILDKCPNAQLVHHHKTVRHLEDPSRLFESSLQTNSYTAELYGRPNNISSDKIIPAKVGDVYKVGDLELEIIDAPGHHSYHYSILERQSETLFVGDSCGWYWKEMNAIFPTTPPPRFDYLTYKDTINKHINSEPKQLAFTHFDIVSENIIDMLYNSIDVTQIWYELLKECKYERNLTAEESINTLIKEKYPQFTNLDRGLKDVIFGISTLGIFNYLDQMEIDMK